LRERQNDSKLERITGIWEKTSKAGIKYWTTTLKKDDLAKLYPNCKLFIFEVREKAGENSPDLTLMVETKDDDIPF